VGDTRGCGLGICAHVSDAVPIIKAMDSNLFIGGGSNFIGELIFYLRRGIVEADY
jgi:hypothetical protein